MAGHFSALTTRGLTLLALVAGALAYQGFREPASFETLAEAGRPRYHLEGAHWRRYGDTGEPVFEATADSIDYFDDASMELSGIDLVTRGARGGWQLNAARGRVAAGERRLLLEPQVDIHGDPKQQPGTEIHTPTLWVDWSRRTLSTTDAVVALAPGRSLEAVGMRADWSGQRVDFLQRVEVRHDPRP